MSMYEQVKEKLKQAGQEHVLEQWHGLSTEKQEQMLADLEDVDFDYLHKVFTASMAATGSASDGIVPWQDVLAIKDMKEEQVAAWRQVGYELIAKGKAAVLLLAGGQGTRLGSSKPKGCYNVGLPSRKSLFQLQAERLLRLQQLAAEAVYGPGALPVPNSSATEAKQTAKPLRWYIMTSPFTHADTLAHFESHGFFGLHRDQVVLFQQGFLPALTEQGKLIMETDSRLAKAPDGNGGVYIALARSGALADMQKHGVEALDCYCVDNILARLGDPLFLGYCHSRGAQCGARAVAKAYPEEKVGVFASRGEKLAVVEYSELDPNLASAHDPTTGQLLFNWSNICMHYFSVDWLQQVHTSLKEQGSAYHVARKKIPSRSGEAIPGMKLELFIFDTFPLAQRFALMEVDRRDEFAPVKNAPGTPMDSPDTARAAVLDQGRRWVTSAGGRVVAAAAAPAQEAAATREDDPAAASDDAAVSTAAADATGQEGGGPAVLGVEVSPLVSYAGEGLQELCNGNTFTAPLDSRLQGCSNSGSYNDS